MLGRRLQACQLLVAIFMIGVHWFYHFLIYRPLLPLMLSLLSATKPAIQTSCQNTTTPDIHSASLNASSILACARWMSGEFLNGFHSWRFKMHITLTNHRLAFYGAIACSRRKRMSRSSRTTKTTVINLLFYILEMEAPNYYGPHLTKADYDRAFNNAFLWALVSRDSYYCC